MDLPIDMQSVAVLCMLFKIKSNQIHPLSGALPLQYVSGRGARGDFVAHMHSFAPPRCRASEALVVGLLVCSVSLEPSY